MAYRIKVPSRSLPVDEAQLVGTLEERLTGLKDYRTTLLLGVGALLLVGGIVWAVSWYDADAASKAKDLEREATLHYLTRPANDPKKVEANLKEAITLYKKIADEYPRTPSAPLALFGAGNAMMESNQVDAAIETYNKLLSTYASNTPLADLVRQKLAYAYLLKGDRAQAEQLYSAILNAPVALNRDQALFELARLDESQSRPDAALTRYQELIKSYPNSPYASEAALREKILDARKSHETSAPSAQTPAPPPAPAKP